MSDTVIESCRYASHLHDTSQPGCLTFPNPNRIRAGLAHRTPFDRIVPDDSTVAPDGPHLYAPYAGALVYGPAHALRILFHIRRLSRSSLQTVLYRGLGPARFTRFGRLRTLALGPVSSLGRMDESLEPQGGTSCKADP